ncbi:MAG: M23 family metallopeptidase [candidate division Zixibacteria bacterium]|nr:M23 family metallopeptidase [candidate division Zixibacteria bacterium]
MLQVSTKLLSLLILLTMLASRPKAGQDWPLEGNIDLSSCFGDYRDGHFHFGIDLRTGGKSGKRVLAPVDGYVWRISTSYEGYGKALYIRGDDGYTYVFGHLSQFIDKVDNLLKIKQTESERYYQDIYLPEDSIRVEKGKLVAFSGKTGTGAPHLHFEKRQNETPLNPIKFGFDLDDNTHPTFSRFGICLTDDRSLLPNGRRKLFMDVAQGKKGNYFIVDTTFYLNRPFGLLSECFDRGRPRGMKHDVYKLSLYIDDKQYYKIKFDSLDFKTLQSVSLEYDYIEVVAKRKHVRRLYKKHGNIFAGGQGRENGGGLFGMDSTEQIGLHHGRVIAEDVAGNETELRFQFLWGPSEYVYHLDSTIEVAKDTTLFHFSPIPEYKSLAIDSVAALLNRGKAWGVSPDVSIEYLDNGRFVCKVVGYRVDKAVLRLELYTSSGVVIHDNLFNGLRERGSKKLEISHEILEDGLLVMIDVFNAKGAKSRLELYWRDSLLGTEYPQYFNMTKHVCFIPPEERYSRIDRFRAAMSRDTSFMSIKSDSLNIAVLGIEPEEKIAFNKYATLRAGKDFFYEPRFVELKWSSVLNKTALKLNSDHYQIFPEAFVCRKDFEISYSIPWKTGINKKSGICWLDENENRWIWLDNSFKDNTLKALSTGGGSFAAVIDYAPPTIERLTIIDGAQYRKTRPPVNFIIKDTISGIPNDTAIRIEIDGQWLIPEYDKETGFCSSRPLEPLEPGRHHLGIMITDRAGNKFEKYLNFIIDEPSNIGK